MDRDTADRECTRAFALAVGMGVQKDPAAAAEIFRRVAHAGYPNGQFGLAELLMGGRGTEKDEAEAFELYAIAAEQGHPESSFRLGILLAEKDPGRAEAYLRKSASVGMVEAMSAMGDLNFEKDPSEAFVWYRSAAEAGAASAAFMCGYMYEEGIGIDRDRKAALVLFEQAAKAGLPEAELKMAHLVDEGAAPGGREACFRWYSLAAGHGMAAAKFNLASMYSDGDGIGKDESKAFLLMSEAAEETQDSIALYIVGVMYLEGIGTERNVDKAVGYLRRSADGGHAAAAQILEIIRRGQNMQLVSIDGTE